MRQQWIKQAIFTGGFSVLVACTSIPSSQKAVPLQVNFQWSDYSYCSRISPAIQLGGVPEETRYLRVRVTDITVPAIQHGGGIVAYDGTALIKEGALENYYGPCSPPGRTHRYRIQVEALGGDHKSVLGVGKRTETFPSQWMQNRSQ